MKIETNRLILIPLSISQLTLLNLNSSEFCNQLRILRNPLISPQKLLIEFQKSIQRIILHSTQDDHYWNTWWVGIDKKK